MNRAAMIGFLAAFMWAGGCHTVCEPDAVRQCTCEDGVPGEQVCDPGGSAWGPCVCEQPAPDLEEDGPTPTPGLVSTPTPMPGRSPTPAPQETPGPEQSPTPEANATPTPAAGWTPEPTGTPVPGLEVTPNPTSIPTPDVSPSPTPEWPAEETPDPVPDFVARAVDNPSCAISCVVLWETDEPATSWVEFGERARPDFRIGSNDLTTSHEVVVVGMRAERIYQLQAVSRTQTGKVLRSQILAYETGSLPFPWMTGFVDVFDEDKVQPGWTLANLVSGTRDGPLTLVMFDMTGAPVWYYTDPGELARLDLQASWLDNRYVLFGPGVEEGEHPRMIDLTGWTLWTGPRQPAYDADSVPAPEGTMHHVFQRLGNGDFITVEAVYRTVDGIENVMGDVVWQFSPTLETTWTWNTFDHLGEIPFSPDLLTASNEWTHTNSVAVVEEENAVYVNSFVLSLTFKVDRSDGHIVWTFGDGGDFAPDPAAAYPWPGSPHSVDPIGDGRFLMYDNGTETRGFSRAVIYHLDEETMQSTIEWEYPGTFAVDPWYNVAGGDVDLLPNGNVLIVGGLGQAPDRIMEVTPDGEKVWQLWFDDEVAKVSAYQAERILPPIQRVDDETPTFPSGTGLTEE